jgi:hypothetical protein
MLGRNDVLLSALRPEIRWAFMHIDLTDTSSVPEQRGEFIASLRRRGITTLNADFLDISKRCLQQACQVCGIPSVGLAGPGDVDGETTVIVKTDRNYGGLPERRLQRCAAQEGEFRGESNDSGEPQYRLYRCADVPERVWGDKPYVVEKFIANSRQLKFRCYLLMNLMSVSAAVDAEPISRMNWGVDRYELYYDDGIYQPRSTEVPASLVGVRRIADGIVGSLSRLRRHLKMDFGSFDVMMDDEMNCFPIDINTTPYWGRDDLHALVRFFQGAKFI